ncbi:MAG: hypothetical protein ABFC91_01135 [Methanobacteriaceae archaeon]
MKKEFQTLTGYISGSKLTPNDIIESKTTSRDIEVEHCFDRNLSEQIGYGAVPIWETYKIFIIENGAVLASVVLDISNVIDWNGAETVMLY